MWKKWLKQPWLWLPILILFLFAFSWLLFQLLPEDAYAELRVQSERIDRLPILPITLSSFALGFLFFLLGIIALYREKTAGSRWMTLAVCCVFLSFFCGFLQPPLGRAYERSRRISCGGNLKQIYHTLANYTIDYDGFLPPDLQTLCTEGFLTDLGVYRCPSPKVPSKEFSDYLYFGNGRKLTDPPFILLRDRHGNHPGMYMNCLMSDGKIHNGYREYSSGAAPGE